MNPDLSAIFQVIFILVSAAKISFIFCHHSQFSLFDLYFIV